MPGTKKALGKSGTVKRKQRWLAARCKSRSVSGLFRMGNCGGEVHAGDDKRACKDLLHYECNITLRHIVCSGSLKTIKTPGSWVAVQYMITCTIFVGEDKAGT